MRRRPFYPLAAFLLLWLVAFVAFGPVRAGPNGNGLAGDFAVFLGGSQALHDGGNLYDPGLLFRTEHALLARQGVPAPAPQSFIRVGNPPLFFWLLQPLTGIPFRLAAVLWLAFLAVLSLVGMLALLRALGWTRRAVPVIGFLAMPQTVLAVYYGNVDAIVFAGIAFALALQRRTPLVAGVLLSASLLKPQVGVPAAGLVILFAGTRRLRLLAGFFSAIIVLAGLSLLITGPRDVSLWIGALGGYSRQIGVQPDIASLAGLYVYSAGNGLRLALGGGSLLIAAVATGWWWWRLRTEPDVPLAAVAWLWVLWFLATPFAHFHDEILLTAPVLALAGRNGCSLGRRGPLTILYLLVASLLLFPVSRLHTDFQSLALLPVLGVALLAALRNADGSRSSRARSLPASTPDPVYTHAVIRNGDHREETRRRCEVGDRVPAGGYRVAPARRHPGGEDRQFERG